MTLFYVNGSYGFDTQAPAEHFEVKKDQNAGTVILATNVTDSTAAYSGLKAASVANSIELKALPAAFTTSGAEIADTSQVKSISEEGLVLNIRGTNADLRVYANDVLRLTIDGSTGVTAVDLLGLKGSTSGSEIIKAAAIAGDVTYTWPAADGTSGQAIVTNGSGVLSFATGAAAPAGTLTGTTLAANVIASSLTSLGVIVNGSNSIMSDELKISGAATKSTSLKRVDAGSDYDLVLPNAQLGADEVLVNDGSGNLSGSFHTIWKQYLGPEGGGGDFEMTSGTWTTVRAVAVPYQTSDGTWRLILNARGTLSGSVSDTTVTVSGVTFAAVDQVITGFGTGSSATTLARAILSSGDLRLTTDANFSTVMFSIDVELTSKPTWAD